MPSALQLAIPRSVYILAFAGAALGCLVTALRARRVSDPEIRRGLVALLLLSGLWATAHLGRMFATTDSVARAAYTAGLVPGLATVGAWLYFCSAYTGRAYHRLGWVRWLSAGSFLIIVTLKLTNPLHGQYFTTRMVTDPFPHVVIVQGTLHWAVTALAYAGSAVGFYMLFELYVDTEQDTTVLGFLVSLTGFPVGLDLLAYASPQLLDFNYEPIGVALFAVGVLYATEESFLAVPKFGTRQIIDNLDAAVILIDTDGVIRRFNDTAARLFDSLDAEGTRLDDTLPGVADKLDSDTPIQIPFDGQPRYYQATATRLTVQGTTIGHGIVCRDVTSIERQRRELRRQNNQLEGFAEAIDHELRNTLNLVTGYTDVAIKATEAGDTHRAVDALKRVNRSANRMNRVVTDLSALARHGQTVENPTECSFRDTVETAWERDGTDGINLMVEGRGTILADRGRLVELFGTLFAFAAANECHAIEIRLTDDGFSYRGDGHRLSETELEDAFAYGEAVPEPETGLFLPNIKTLVQVHDWEIESDLSVTEGVSLRVRGATVVRADDAST